LQPPPLAPAPLLSLQPQLDHPLQPLLLLLLPQLDHPLQPLLLLLLPLLQLLLEEQLSPELMTTLGMLWQPLCKGQALGLHLEEAYLEEGEEVEEAEAEGNQLLSLHNNSSPSHLLLTYESWEHSLESSTEKEIRLTPS